MPLQYSIEYRLNAFFPASSFSSVGSDAMKILRFLDIIFGGEGFLMGEMFPSQTSSSDISKSCSSNESRPCDDRGVVVSTGIDGCDSFDIGGNGCKAGRGTKAGFGIGVSTCSAFCETVCAGRVINFRNFCMAGGRFRWRRRQLWFYRRRRR